MAYSKRNMKRRNSKYGSRRNSKRGPSNKALDKKIKKIQRDIEIKFEDSYEGSIAIDNTTGHMVVLNSMNNGSNVSNRIGNEVRATSIQIRMLFQAPATLVSVAQIRMLLLWDRQANGAFPDLAGASNTLTILDTNVVTNKLLAPFNYNYNERFRILMDKHITLTPQESTVTSATGTPLITTTTQFLGVERYMKKKLKLSRIVKYDGSGAASGIEDIATNSLLLAWVSDVNGATAPTVSYGARFYYKDA